MRNIYEIKNILFEEPWETIIFKAKTIETFLMGKFEKRSSLFITILYWIFDQCLNLILKRFHSFLTANDSLLNPLNRKNEFILYALFYELSTCLMSYVRKYDWLIISDGDSKLSLPHKQGGTINLPRCCRTLLYFGLTSRFSSDFLKSNSDASPYVQRKHGWSCRSRCGYCPNVFHSKASP